MESYFNHPNVSQSQLKTLLFHPRAFTEERESQLYFEEKEHFTIGSAVDFCLTQSDQNFNAVYHVSSIENKPSDTMKSIVKMVFDTSVERHMSFEGYLITDESYKDLILEACIKHNYQNRWTDQTKISKVCEHYEYWEDLKASYGKTILSQEEKTLIDTIVMSLRTSEATGPYFNCKNIRYQLPIYFEYEEVGCKALLDMVIIDEVNMTVQPIDIKTMGDYTINFPISLRKRRYDIQAAFYTEALKTLFPDLTILPFKFIVESTKTPGEPLVFNCSSTLLSIGKIGRPEVFLKGDIADTNGMSSIYYSRAREIVGFSHLIKLYKYHSKKGFDKSKILIDNKSQFQLDWDGIIKK